MKALIILRVSHDHHCSPLYGENELLWGSVHHFGVFLQEQTPPDQGFNIGVHIGTSAKISKNTCV